MKKKKSAKNHSNALVSTALQMQQNLLKKNKIQTKPTSTKLSSEILPPPPPLTNSQWDYIHHKSQNREDSLHPCPICQEDFKFEPQILLSCSHVFHQACIKSFERYSGTKICPICRQEKYQKKEIFDSSNYIYHQSATLIQKIWKGYQVKKDYKYIQQHHLSLDQFSKIHKMHHYSSHIDEYLHNQSNIVKNVINQVDQSISFSQQIGDYLQSIVDLQTIDWTMVQTKALKMNQIECSICFMSLANRSTALLSCSHLFHSTCISSFEKYSLDTFHKCPLCRSYYISVPFSPI